MRCFGAGCFDTQQIPFRASRRAALFLFFLSLSGASCLKISHHPPRAVTHTNVTGQALLDLNSASAAELEKLPGVGPSLAREIVAYRERYGRFRRVEHLLMVRGISERRLAALRDSVEVRFSDR